MRNARNRILPRQRERKRRIATAGNFALVRARFNNCRIARGSVRAAHTVHQHTRKHNCTATMCIASDPPVTTLSSGSERTRARSRRLLRGTRINRCETSARRYRFLRRIVRRSSICLARYYAMEIFFSPLLWNRVQRYYCVGQALRRRATQRETLLTLMRRLGFRISSVRPPAMGVLIL